MYHTLFSPSIHVCILAEGVGYSSRLYLSIKVNLMDQFKKNLLFFHRLVIFQFPIRDHPSHHVYGVE